MSSDPTPGSNGSDTTSTETGLPHSWHMLPPEKPTPPKTDTLPPAGSTCLSFTIKSEFGHFRKIEGNAVRQTYRLIPRTTLAGLVAAIVGLPRDSYYPLFETDVASVAISPVGRLRTINMPQNVLTTTEDRAKHEDMPYLATLPDDDISGSHSISITIPDPTTPRQRRNFEVLVDPAYRIDLWLASDPLSKRLHTYLAEGRSVYPPTMGTSQFPVSVTYHGTQEVGEPLGSDDASTTVPIDSACPGGTDVLATWQNIKYTTERSPATLHVENSVKDGYETSIGNPRTTTSFRSWVIPQKDDQLQVNPDDVSIRPVGKRRVVFT